MGNSKTKTFLEPSARTIYPWVVYTEPSEYSSQLVRLCITHQESDRFLILETYYPDEIELAVASLIKAVHKRKHMLLLEMLTPSTQKVGKLFKVLCDMMPQSRSTPEFAKIVSKTNAAAAVLVGGVREF